MDAVFVDTSAFYALLVADDRKHAAAVAALERLRVREAELVTSPFVLQETISLLQARIGMPAVRAFVTRIVTGLRIEWVDEDLFRGALTALLAADSRSISLTDWTSFEIMRRSGIREAFAFDEDFAARGFELV